MLEAGGKGMGKPHMGKAPGSKNSAGGERTVVFFSRLGGRTEIVKNEDG